MKRCMGCMETYRDDVYLCPYCGYEENTVPEETFHLTPGTMLGNRYQVGRVLGFGGFGVTYIGFDILLEKKVAIKEYLPSEFATRMPSQTKLSIYSGEKTEQFEQGMSKFVEEARRLAKFSETAEIVNVYDCITENNTAYIIMEYLEGESLKNYLEKNGKLSVEETERIILPIMKSLQSVHEAGLIHRDIAPDNIFLTTDGRVKLLDFGAARYASATHSRSLSVIYKPGYAPIEQYQSRGDQGAWTDVYALAATMYKMLTGITPETSIERLANDNVKPPSKLGVQISKNKETALLNALNIQAKNRTRSTAQFVEEWESQSAVVRLVDTIKKADVGKLSKKAKIAILTSVAVIGAGIAFLFAMGGFKKISQDIFIQAGKTRVPSVVNETMDEAQAITEEAALLLEITGKEYSSEIAKDLILNQSEKSGSLVDTGIKLGVVVSGGIKQVYMPVLSGMSEEKAVDLLKQEGFEISIIEETSDVVAPGNVIRTSIPADTQCDMGTRVTVYISKGAELSDKVETLVVENYVGMTEEEVTEILRNYGIYLDSGKKTYHDTLPAGAIVEQSASIGTELKTGDILVVTVSLGKQKIRIPDVELKERNVAEQEIATLLNSLGLGKDAIIIQWKEDYHATIRSGLVISQSVNAGVEVEKGSVIELLVSKGPKPADTPVITPVPHTHDYNHNVTTSNQPTCTEQGMKKFTCACGEYQVEAIPATGHSEVNIAGKEPTCTETGLTTGKKCSICGTTTLAQTEIAKKPHTEVDVAGKAATCTETGISTGKKCSICGTTTVAQTQIAKKPHTEVDVAGKAATCKETGLTVGKKCSVCGTTTVAQNTIPLAQHTPVTVSAKPATCTTDGLTEGTKCSVCNTALTAQERINAFGHYYDRATDLDCHTCGYVRGYWTGWVDNGVNPVYASETREVYTQVVTDTLYRYRYSRYLWYKNGVLSSSKNPPSGYDSWINYSSWYYYQIPMVIKTYASGPVTTYDCGGNTYYTEHSEAYYEDRTHYFYRDVVYY